MWRLHFLSTIPLFSLFVKISRTNRWECTSFPSFSSPSPQKWEAFFCCMLTSSMIIFNVWAIISSSAVVSKVIPAFPSLKKTGFELRFGTLVQSAQAFPVCPIICVLSVKQIFFIFFLPIQMVKAAFRQQIGCRTQKFIRIQNNLLCRNGQISQNLYRELCTHENHFLPAKDLCSRVEAHISALNWLLYSF